MVCRRYYDSRWQVKESSQIRVSHKKWE